MGARSYVTFGPVSAAQQSQPPLGGAVFTMGIGVSVLTYLWYRFLTRTEEEQKPPIEYAAATAGKFMA